MNLNNIINNLMYSFSLHKYYYNIKNPLGSGSWIQAFTFYKYKQQIEVSHTFDIIFEYYHEQRIGSRLQQFQELSSDGLLFYFEDGEFQFFDCFLVFKFTFIDATVGASFRFQPFLPVTTITDLQRIPKLKNTQH